MTEASKCLKSKAEDTSGAERAPGMAGSDLKAIFGRGQNES